jgi:hypothetical protein
MPEAQVLGAVAVRVGADISEYQETMRALRTGMQAMERVPITIRVQLSASDAANVRAQLAELRGGGGGSAFAASSVSPNITVDGRGYLVGAAGFGGGGGGGGGGGRFFASGGNVGTVPIGISATQARATVIQAANMMRAAAAQIPAVTIPVQAGGANIAAGGGGFTIPGAGGGGGGAGILGGRGLGAMMALHMLVRGGESYLNAGETYNRDMALARNFGDQSQAEVNYQRSRNDAIPFGIGSLGYSISSGMGSAFNATGHPGGSALAASLLTAPASPIVGAWAASQYFRGGYNAHEGFATQGQIDVTNAQATQQEQWTAIQHGSQQEHLGTQSQIAITAKHFDSIAKATAEINESLRKRKDTINQTFQKELEIAGELSGDQDHDNQVLSRRGMAVSNRTRAIADADALAGAQRKVVAEETSQARYDAATHGMVAAVHINATGQDSDQYIAQRSSALARGRELAKEIALAPEAIRGDVRNAAVAEILAQRADITRVGSKTFTESFDSGFANIDALKATGGGAEEQRKMVDLLTDIAGSLDSIKNTKAVLGD